MARPLCPRCRVPLHDDGRCRFRIAGPWQHEIETAETLDGPRQNAGSARRHKAGGRRDTIAIVERAGFGYRPWWWSATLAKGRIATREEALAAADAALVAAGWKLAP